MTKVIHASSSLWRRIRLRCSGDGQYGREIVAATVAYVAVLVPTIVVVNANQDAAWRFPVAVLPMIPIVFALVAWVRSFRRMDELQQRIALEALAFAFGGTAFITFSYGFLQDAGFPDLNWFYVWPIMAGLWTIGDLLAKRRWL